MEFHVDRSRDMFGCAATTRSTFVWNPWEFGRRDQVVSGSSGVKFAAYGTFANIAGSVAGLKNLTDQRQSLRPAGKHHDKSIKLVDLFNQRHGKQKKKKKKKNTHESQRRRRLKLKTSHNKQPHDPCIIDVFPAERGARRHFFFELGHARAVQTVDDGMKSVTTSPHRLHNVWRHWVTCNARVAPA